MRFATVMLLLLTAAGPATRPALVVGTLQSSVARVAEVQRAGVTLATVSLAWDRFEPERGKVDHAYVQQLQAAIAGFRKAGQAVQIDLGLQYPPAWVRKLPDSRFVNQYGDAYIDERPGANIVNAVFNRQVRDLQAAYVAAVFKSLGNDFADVRLGWNYYGELGYPAAKFKDHTNCYWAFDRLAQGGDEKQLPDKIAPCPVPGWKPGMSSEAHHAAAAFANWYIDSLAAYERWQIATVRRFYAGRLLVLLGSWGVRPGVRIEEVQNDLGTATQTEISLGYDFGRLVAAIDDDGTAVCTTWIDSNPTFGNDEDESPRRWSPVHYLQSITQPRHLELWAENTGNADAAAMKLSFERARRYGVSTLVWAFEPDLFDGQHASLADLRPLMDERPPASHNPKP